MTNRNKFRTLVIGHLIASICCAGAVHILDDGQLDEARAALTQVYDLDAVFFSHTTVFLIITGTIALLSIVAIVGALLFRNWARWLNVAMVLAMVPFSILIGPAVYSGWETAIWDLSNIIYGGIIALMFLPPIANEFDQIL